MSGAAALPEADFSNNLIVSRIYNVDNLKTFIVRKSGSPARRTERRKSQKNELSGIRGLLCAEQKRRKSQKLHFHKFRYSAAQRGAAEARPPSVVSFVLALNKAHVRALNTAHVSRLAGVSALNKAQGHAK